MRWTLLSPIADVIDYGHSQGLIHRDIKPSNILLRPDGVPMMSDFGLAKIIDSVKITASGFVVGTPDYMSPEQANGDPLGPATDLYALAIMAHEMLTGRVPFQADTPAGVLMSHVKQAMPPTPDVGLTSRTGVPCTASRWFTWIRPSMTATTSTRWRPIGLGRSWERRLKTPR
jgi:serine/threonine protein kinase